MQSQRAFTLVEMVIAITLIGIVAGLMAVFLKLPMGSHMVARQRMSLADSADAAQRLFEYELRHALPNSVRVTTAGGVTYLEFLATRGEGRARTTAGSGTLCGGGSTDHLQTGAVDTCFTSLGNFLSHDGSAIVPGQDYVVTNNLIASAYSNGAANGPNKARITSYTAGVALPPEGRFQFAGTNFPAFDANGANRFYVVTGPVTYACNTAAGQLRRYSGYAISIAQPAPPAVAPSIVTANVGACSLRYLSAVPGLRERLVVLNLGLARNVPGEARLEQAFVFGEVPVRVQP